ncbi:MAG: hypothetical protein LBT78_00905, partial [Tannerella sp.]|nr:hypothetical protein [Tannerella sp.]
MKKIECIQYKGESRAADEELRSHLIHSMMKKVLLVWFLIFTGISLCGQNYRSNTTLPGGTTNNVSDETTKSGLQNVVIVYKTHFDIGYSERVQQVLHDYRTSMSDLVLETIDRYRDQPKEKQFVWTLSGYPMQQIISEGQEPGRRKKIEQAIAEGNLVVHAYPFTIHTESSDLEDMVRGLNISSTLARRFNRPLSISAKSTDVPGHSWIIPTLFTHAGIKFYHMGGPVVNKTQNLPPVFWWEGPDGSRLLTFYNNAYGTEPYPPKDWPYKTWLYINMTGDNQGPPPPEIVAENIESYRKNGIHAIVGSMDDFAAMLLKEDLSGLPVVRTDISDVWIHGTMSQPEATKQIMNIRPAIGALEQLTTLETIWGIYRPDTRETISKAYEQSLLYSEHTWGLANQHYIKVPYGKDWQALWERGLPAQYRLMEESWQDQADYADNVRYLVEKPYRDAVASLADNVQTEVNRVVVYNPLPWKRDGYVEMDTRLLFGDKYQSLKPAEGGPAIAVSHEYPAIEDVAPVSRFIVPDIPPMGYRTFVASQEKAIEPELTADEKRGVIESPFFKATMDAKRGCILSLIDKRTGKELVDTGAPHDFGQYLYERFSFKEISGWIDKSLYPQYSAHRFLFAAYDMPRDTEYASAVPQEMTLTLEKTPVDVRATLTGTLPGPGQPQKIAVSLLLSGYAPTAEIEVSWQKQPDTWPEAAWLCLPFRCDNARFQLGRLGADVEPGKDMIVENANHHIWWVNNGACVYDAKTGTGYGLCSPDAPLLSLGEPGEYRFDAQYTSEKPYMYINLYNNHWRTNFAGWIGHGQRMSAKVRLWSF